MPMGIFLGDSGVWKRGSVPGWLRLERASDLFGALAEGGAGRTGAIGAGDALVEGDDVRDPEAGGRGGRRGRGRAC